MLWNALHFPQTAHSRVYLAIRYAVVQHTGSLQSGHYTAYIKDTVVPSKGGPAAAQWFHVSDEKYTVCTLAEVLRAEAYILFYERIGVDQIGSSTTRVTGL